MDVLALERAYWEAMKNGDSEGVEKLTDESCIVVGPEGIGEFDPKTVGAMVEDMPYELQSYEIGQDAKVRMLAGTSPSSRIRSTSRSTETVRPRYWMPSVRRDGHWMCAMHTETISAPASR